MKRYTLRLLLMCLRDEGGVLDIVLPGRTHDFSEERVCLGELKGRKETMSQAFVALITLTSCSNFKVESLCEESQGGFIKKVSCQRICNILWWVLTIVLIFKILKTLREKLLEAGAVFLKVFHFKQKDSIYFNMNDHSHSDSRFETCLILLKSLRFFMSKIVFWVKYGNYLEKIGIYLDNI